MMSQLMQRNHLHWGSITLVLDEHEFRKGFVMGRACYFADIHDEFPERAQRMNVQEASQMIGTATVTGEGWLK
jgi:hypothetical protein